MSERDIVSNVGAADPPRPVTAGAMLVAARESSGMSIDAVAQQLKLAPRQVTALETGDYTHLPGRTFVRGFMRNYARLLRLDPDAVLAALPAGAAEPNLESPTLHSTAPTIGELPTTDHSKPGWTRWAIPLTLAAIVAAAGVYEWLRPAGEGHSGGRDAAGVAGRAAQPPVAADKPRASAATSAPAGADRPGAPPPTGQGAASADGAGTPLPNPLAAAAPATEIAPAASATSAPSASPPGIGEQPLVLAFRDYSWSEVRDRDGRVLLSKMNPGGTTQFLSGAPPLELVIGNASDVALTWKGRAIDLAPYTRQNVARLTLP